MHNGLKTVPRRRTQESWPGLWRGTHADQIWYLGLVLPNEAPIVAFLFTPARLEPSQLSFCCRFTLFYQRFHCSEGAGVGPDCQATAPNQGTPEPASCLAKDGGFFYWGSALRSRSSRGRDYTGQPGLNAADLTAVSSFPHGDVVICSNTNLDLNEFLTHKEQLAVKWLGTLSIRSYFWPDLHFVSSFERRESQFGPGSPAEEDSNNVALKLFDLFLKSLDNSSVQSFWCFVLLPFIPHQGRSAACLTHCTYRWRVLQRCFNPVRQNRRWECCQERFPPAEWDQWVTNLKSRLDRRANRR